MTKDSILGSVIKVLEGEFGPFGENNHITQDTKLSDFDIDSLGLTELQLAFEEKFNVEILDENWGQFIGGEFDTGSIASHDGSYQINDVTVGQIVGLIEGLLVSVTA